MNIGAEYSFLDLYFSLRRVLTSKVLTRPVTGVNKNKILIKYSFFYA